MKVGETSELIQYSFQPQAYDFLWSGEYWTDLSLSLRYSVERIVPFKLMEFSDQKLYSASKAAYNFPVTLGYTVASILYVYFMISGLRRHFKRY